MMDRVQLNPSEKTLVVSCTECALTTLSSSSIFILQVPCQVVETDEQLPEFLKAIREHRPVKIVIVGHDDCKIIPKTLFGNDRLIANSELYYYLETILHRIACRSDVKPNELFREVARETVRSQVRYVRKLLSEQKETESSSIEVVAAWMNEAKELFVISN